MEHDLPTWWLLELALPLPPNNPIRLHLAALADAWEELPPSWRALLDAAYSEQRSPTFYAGVEVV